jgi:hypothetical protein
MTIAEKYEYIRNVLQKQVVENTEEAEQVTCVICLLDIVSDMHARLIKISEK